MSNKVSLKTHLSSGDDETSQLNPYEQQQGDGAAGTHELDSVEGLISVSSQQMMLNDMK